MTVVGERVGVDATVSRTITGVVDRCPDGLVEIDGPAGGLVQVVDGCIAFAETDAAPGIGERFVGLGVLGDDEWRALVAAGADVAGTLLATGRVGRHLLDSLVESSVVDALEAMLGAGAQLGAAHAGVAHWFGSPLRLATDELAWKISRLLRERPDRLTAESRIVIVADPRRSRVVLTRAQWNLLCQVTGSRTVLDVARAAGQPLHDALLVLAGLVAEGLCEAENPAPSPAAGSGVAGLVPLPRREPRRPPSPIAVPQPRAGAPAFATPDEALLRRVLDALREL